MCESSNKPFELLLVTGPFLETMWVVRALPKRKNFRWARLRRVALLAVTDFLSSSACETRANLWCERDASNEEERITVCDHRRHCSHDPFCVLSIKASPSMPNLRKIFLPMLTSMKVNVWFLFSFTSIRHGLESYYTIRIQCWELHFLPHVIEPIWFSFRAAKEKFFGVLSLLELFALLNSQKFLFELSSSERKRAISYISVERAEPRRRCIKKFVSNHFYRLANVSCTGCHSTTTRNGEIYVDTPWKPFDW